MYGLSGEVLLQDCFGLQSLGTLLLMNAAILWGCEQGFKVVNLPPPLPEGLLQGSLAYRASKCCCC